MSTGEHTCPSCGGTLKVICVGGSSEGYTVGEGEYYLAWVCSGCRAEYGTWMSWTLSAEGAPEPKLTIQGSPKAGDATASEPIRKSSEAPDAGGGNNGVFIAHSSSDKATARKLAVDLRARGIQTWYDEWEIRVGDSIVEKISAGLRRQAFMVLLLSRHFPESKWLHREFAAGLATHIETARLKILPARLDDTEIPVLLKDIRYADFRSDYGRGLWDVISAIRPVDHTPALNDLEKALILELWRVKRFRWENQIFEWFYRDKPRSDAFDALLHWGVIELNEVGGFPSGGLGLGAGDLDIIEYECRLTDTGKAIAHRLVSG